MRTSVGEDLFKQIVFVCLICMKTVVVVQNRICAAAEWSRRQSESSLSQEHPLYFARSMSSQRRRNGGPPCEDLYGSHSQGRGFLFSRRNERIVRRHKHPAHSGRHARDPAPPITDTPVWCAPITAARATQPARLPSRVLRRQTTMVCTCGPDCTCTDGSCGCGTGSCACDPGACPAKKQKELQNKIFVGGAIAVALIATAMIVMKK